MSSNNLPCGVIKDLLPLYHDGVCSEESRKLVEEHLAECPACKEEYETFSREGKLLPASENTTDIGQLSAVSLKQVHRLILWKRVTASAFAILVLLAGIFGGICWMKNQSHLISYDSEKDNIRVSYEETGDLAVRLYGSDWETIHALVIELEKKQILLFSMTATAWDDITAGDNHISYYTLVSGDSELAPDAVYYMYGDISSYSYDELVELFAKGDGPFTKLWEAE